MKKVLVILIVFIIAFVLGHDVAVARAYAVELQRKAEAFKIVGDFVENNYPRE